MRVLITGGAGFIGTNLVHHWCMNHPQDEILVLDALTYAGNLGNLDDLPIRFQHGDVAKRAHVALAMAFEPELVLHLAAESHVDRSIVDPGAFVRTNILGTQILLDALRTNRKARFLYVSTDEVMGSLGPRGFFTEETPLAPNSPYAASKAAGELLCRSYHHTYGMDIVITRCSNNYGPYQFPEKMLPLFILNLMEGQPVPLYGDGQNVRDWLHVTDHCRALDLVAHKGFAGEVYGIGGHNEITNRELTDMLITQLWPCLPGSSPIRFVPDRPGHDRRYAMDAGKIERELGWRPAYTFNRGLEDTIAWYQNHRSWWEPLRERAIEATRARANKE